jgi:DNA recombination protein RmuC
MAEYCDFETQTTTGEAEDRQRPDMVIHLPGNRTIIVDSKVPLASYLDATEAVTDKDRREKMLAHAKAVRDRMKELSLKSYWDQFNTAPEYVVLFLPGESFFSAAAELDRELIADGIQNRVILATPTTLIMALLTVAHSWHQQQLAENAQQIAEAGKGLFESLCVFIGHLDDIRTGLHKANESYNKAVGSWERNVQSKARRLKELGAAKPDQELPELKASDGVLRHLPPPEKRAEDEATTS